MNTLLLGGVSPQEEREFLYSPNGEFHGEAAMLLEVAGLSAAGKAREAVHAEFQRAGFFLTHVLECALEKDSQDGPGLSSLLVRRLPAVAIRIRRSLKPKRVVLISRALEPLVEKIAALRLGCPLVLDEGRPFDLDGPNARKAAARLREAIAAATG
jgi:hypothetical protein